MLTDVGSTSVETFLMESEYQATETKIRHEDSLLMSRVGWLVGIEAFLFGPYVAVLNGHHDHAPAARLLWVLPGLGILTAFAMLSGILAAIFEIHRLQRKKEKLDHELPASYPEHIGDPRNHRLGLVPAIGLPVLVIAAWSCTVWP